MTVNVLTAQMPTPLIRHLRSWAGAVPTRAGVAIIANPRVAQLGWNGRPELLTGLVSPEGGCVVSLPPGPAYAAASLLGDSGPVDVLPALLGQPERSVERRVYRWTTRPADLPRIGTWLPADAPDVPAWLRPFGGEVLAAVDSRRPSPGLGRHQAARRARPRARRGHPARGPRARHRTFTRRSGRVSGPFLRRHPDLPARARERCIGPSRGSRGVR